MDYSKIRKFIDDDVHRIRMPFISTISTDESTFKGVIINSDKSIVSIIDLSKFKDDKKLYDFVELCFEWWWYSTRNVPINLLYSTECLPYIEYISHIPNKSSVTIQGHEVSLESILKNRKVHRKNKSLNIRD